MAKITIPKPWRVANVTFVEIDAAIHAAKGGKLDAALPEPPFASTLPAGRRK